MKEIEIALTAIKLYAETHPRPTQVTQAQASEMLGLSHPTVRKLVRNGTLSLNACGLIPIELIDLARDGQRPPLCRNTLGESCVNYARFNADFANLGRENHSSP